MFFVNNNNVNFVIKGSLRKDINRNSCLFWWHLLFAYAVLWVIAHVWEIKGSSHLPRLLLFWSQGTHLLFSGGSQHVVPVVHTDQLRLSATVPIRTATCRWLWRKRAGSGECKSGECQPQTDTGEYQCVLERQPSLSTFCLWSFSKHKCGTICPEWVEGAVK